MVRPLLVAARISLSACGRLVPANASRSCKGMPIEYEQSLSALMEPLLPAVVKMKQCVSGMRIQARASRSYEDIPTWFAPSPVKVWAGGQTATPEVASLHVNVTVTFVLFQPAALGAGDT